jgi:hypothetical protein
MCSNEHAAHNLTGTNQGTHAADFRGSFADVHEVSGLLRSAALGRQSEKSLVSIENMERVRTPDPNLGKGRRKG